MKYPTEFAATVKSVFPDWSEMHEALDNGHEVVGRYLEEQIGYADVNLYPGAIVAAFEHGEQHEIYEAAKRNLQIRQLYGQWEELHLVGQKQVAP